MTTSQVGFWEKLSIICEEVSYSMYSSLDKKTYTDEAHKKDNSYFSVLNTVSQSRRQ